ncbi:MAG TPA: glycosyltransferase [Bacteroidales bacterium]|nr:glycosyltransferase [Bacteroidales bacterium]
MGRRRNVIVAVTNDLATDQRVERSCSLLHEMGFNVLLIGRRLKQSPAIPQRPYSLRRMMLPWSRGPMFYAAFNLRLFCFILWRRADLIVANDLDTLLPCFLVSRIRGIPLVYDSHEYFTGVPELEGRPVVRRVWKGLERRLFPRLRYLVTVNASIATLYEQEYGKRPAVVRNVPRRRERSSGGQRPAELPPSGRLIILQGAGINVDRGAEEALQAMAHLDHAHMIIVGGGDVIPRLKALREEAGLQDRVHFFPRMPYEELMRYTEAADIGLSLDKATNINYRFSLPNKVFDYIQAGIPILCSELPEVAGLVREYELGLVTPSHEPEVIAGLLEQMLGDEARRRIWKENLNIASRTLCWENEKETLREIYATACNA